MPVLTKWAASIALLLTALAIGGGAMWQRRHPQTSIASLAEILPAPAGSFRREAMSGSAARPEARGAPTYAPEDPAPRRDRERRIASPCRPARRCPRWRRRTGPAPRPWHAPPPAPRFDIVRVEPSGDTVVAGSGRTPTCQGRAAVVGASRRRRRRRPTRQRPFRGAAEDARRRATIRAVAAPDHAEGHGLDLGADACTVVGPRARQGIRGRWHWRERAKATKVLSAPDCAQGVGAGAALGAKRRRPARRRFRRRSRQARGGRGSIRTPEPRRCVRRRPRARRRFPRVRAPPSAGHARPRSTSTTRISPTSSPAPTAQWSGDDQARASPAVALQVVRADAGPCAAVKTREPNPPFGTPPAAKADAAARQGDRPRRSAVRRAW